MTSILTVHAARQGDEHYYLTLYSAFGGKHKEWRGDVISLHYFAEVAALWAREADFVCVDTAGLGQALVDMLMQRGITALLSTGRRPPP